MSERWATFDCYGTLIDWDGGLSATFARLWPDKPFKLLQDRYHLVEPTIQEYGSLPYREVMRRVLRAIAAIEDLPLETDQEYALSEALPSWEAFPEVPAALRRLRVDGWKLAILSNTDPDLLAASVDNIGVPFDLTITAHEAGSYKPAFGHWQRFWADTGADHERQVHVAASLFHDIAPARELGLRSVWINRLGEKSDLPRAAELPDLERLPATLNGLVPAED